MSEKWGWKERSIILCILRAIQTGSKKILVLEIIFNMRKNSSIFEFEQISRWPQLSFSILVFIANLVFFLKKNRKIRKRCWGPIDGTPCICMYVNEDGKMHFYIFCLFRSSQNFREEISKPIIQLMKLAMRSLKLCHSMGLVYII